MVRAKSVDHTASASASASTSACSIVWNQNNSITTEWIRFGLQASLRLVVHAVFATRFQAAFTFMIVSERIGIHHSCHANKNQNSYCDSNFFSSVLLRHFISMSTLQHVGLVCLVWQKCTALGYHLAPCITNNIKHLCMFVRMFSCISCACKKRVDSCIVWLSVWLWRWSVMHGLHFDLPCKIV